MRILYVGPLNRGGTCYSRFVALKELESEVLPFDTIPLVSNLTQISRLMGSGPLLRSANASLLETASKNQIDCVWVDKGFWIQPETLRRLKTSGVLLIQHNTDSLHPKNLRYWLAARLLRLGLKYYDWYLTTNQIDFQILQHQNPPRTLFTHIGYDDTRFTAELLAPEVQGRWAHEVLFVGHYEPRTAERIRALIDANIPVTVYGSGWEFVRRKKPFCQHVTGLVLSDHDYVLALKSAKICLGFVSEWNSNQTAGRSFEIPACGSFLLAERSPQHLQCYREGEEAEFFSDSQELVQKTRFYLDHPQERQKIQLAGIQRLKSSNYSWRQIMAQDWRQIIGTQRFKTKEIKNYVTAH